MKPDVRHRKLAAVASAEAAGLVADSMEVRNALLASVEAGGITLEQAQADLKEIRKRASRNGKTTRGQAWRAG